MYGKNATKRIISLWFIIFPPLSPFFSSICVLLRWHHASSQSGLYYILHDLSLSPLSQSFDLTCVQFKINSPCYGTDQTRMSGSLYHLLWTHGGSVIVQHRAKVFGLELMFAHGLAFLCSKRFRNLCLCVLSEQMVAVKGAILLKSSLFATRVECA